MIMLIQGDKMQKKRGCLMLKLNMFNIKKTNLEYHSEGFPLESTSDLDID